MRSIAPSISRSWKRAGKPGLEKPTQAPHDATTSGSCDAFGRGGTLAEDYFKASHAAENPRGPEAEVQVERWRLARGAGQAGRAGVRRTSHPSTHVHPSHPRQEVHPRLLVVQQGPQRREVEDPHAPGRAPHQEVQSGKQPRLGLAAGGGREDDGVVPVQDGLHRQLLDGAQLAPAQGVDDGVAEALVEAEEARG